LKQHTFDQLTENLVCSYGPIDPTASVVDLIEAILIETHPSYGRFQGRLRMGRWQRWQYVHD
jgi:hypothetical protein